VFRLRDRIDVHTARELLDFAAGGGGVVSPTVAEEQLRGAVAIHNMLQVQDVAYLADEVGMGKTYVALGAMALLRHFRPELRVMVLAPKENIQTKWIKEWRNFVSSVVRVEDLRVKAVGGHPARALVKVNSLVDLVTEASNDPDRDFFVRLTSFSLPVAGSDGTLGKRRAQLLRALPWLTPSLIDANRKDYKSNFGRAVNCALPDIDLLIVDEAHNLKAGWKEGKSSSTRNTVIGCALGGRSVEGGVPEFKGYRRRVKKVLFLSATPIEYDIRQLWNQLDLFGFSAGWESLKDPKLDHSQHRDVVRKLLIRRTAEVVSGEQRLTKSEYRREWRGGGIASHDDPLKAADARQRLAVALVQKKVAEILGSGEHNHSFQVGLLASFESKTKIGVEDQASEGEDESEDALFHRSAEERSATGEERRDGADIDAINRIAKDHLKTFNKEMPHPKMDAIVEELAESFTTGRKALVFVRRVASVDELQRKLEERYDQLLFTRLLSALGSDALRAEMQSQIDLYCTLRQEGRHGIRARDEFKTAVTDDTEPSGVDSFFAWFFRGKGPDGVRSGATIALDLEKASSAYSTLLEDNYLAAVFGVRPSEVLSALANVLRAPIPEIVERVGRDAARYLGAKGSVVTSRARMRAFQAAGLYLLSEVPGRTGNEAQTILRNLFATPVRDERRERLEAGAERWLGERTFFSELRHRPSLKERLWPDGQAGEFVDALREREIRRELMSTMIRKGHPIIDIFVIIANRLGSIRRGARELAEKDLPDLAEEILAELERQRLHEPDRFNSFQELAESAGGFHLITRLNAPELREADLARVPTILGKTLRAQRPVAGMAGKVNTEVVKQFRMPGYPLILVTTDLLKEGEDLHTFCSNVYHYGIAWMPSELEQRVGRVDRVGSQTERRLGAPRSGNEDELLQVYYPHLNDTVEVLQLRRVYERLNRFMRMMHEGLGVPQKEQAEVHVGEEGLRFQVDTQAIRTPLVSAFKVTPAMTQGERIPLAVTTEAAERMRDRLDAIEKLVAEMGATSITRREGHQVVGEMQLGSRVQPFTVILRSLRGQPLLRCVSPVGQVGTDYWDDDFASLLKATPFVRLALERNERFESYDVAIEGDILLGAPPYDLGRARDLIHAVITAADRLEDQVLGQDLALPALSPGLHTEVNVAR
jgi:Type III restriction enzyme, res subunit/Helicase conserved C-terminal domain